MLDCRANAKFYAEFFRSRHAAEGRPGKQWGAARAIADARETLGRPEEFSHAYYAKLNSPQVRREEFELGLNGNLSFGRGSFDPHYRMNRLAQSPPKGALDSREALVRRMYNPHMLHRDFAGARLPRANLKSEMQALSQMLQENLH